MDVLNILSGQALQEKLHHLLEGSGSVPFNEAMCSYETNDTIFSDEFIRLRASEHQVSSEQYENMVIDPLRPLFEKQYPCMVLWFGDDMFCQINLLTVLGYLDQVGYKGSVIFRKVNEMNGDYEDFEVFPEGYKEIYEQVLIKRCMPRAQLMPVMLRGVQLYLEYAKEENEITAFIRKNLDKSQDELLQQLFHVFPHYGLGDTQYLKIIKSI